MRDFPLHTAVVVALLGGGLAARVLTPGAPSKPIATPVESAPTAASTPAAVKDRPAPLLDDSAGVMDHFYRALQRTEAKEVGAVTRIVHYGDSPTTADLITGDVRSILQAQLGTRGTASSCPPNLGLGISTRVRAWRARAGRSGPPAISSPATANSGWAA